MNKIYFNYDIYFFITEIFLLITILILLIYGVVLSTSIKYGYPILVSNIGWLSVQILFFTFFILKNSNIVVSLEINNFLIFDNLGKLIKIFILIVSVCCLLISISYLKFEKINIFEYFILLLFSILAIFLVISSNDLISIYLALEFKNLVFYILSAIKRNSEFSTEGALKYFILGSFSSGLLLFGISIIYGFTGLTNFEDLNKFFSNLVFSDILNIYSGIFLGLILIAISFFFKLSAAPFHMWSPDVYEGVPSIVIAFFTIISKIIIFILFIRLFNISFHDLFFTWQKIIIFCAFISLIIGTFSAFSQIKFKRFLAYSSIGHIGYIFIGLASISTNGFLSLIIYILIYIIIIIGIFSILLSLRQFNNFNSIHQIRYISEFNILSKTNPILAFSLTLIIFSMAGIPPLAGFFGKLLIFLTSLESSLYILTIIGVLISCVACFYYIRIIKIIYFDNLRNWPIFIPIDKNKSILLSSVILIISLFCLNPSLFLIPNIILIYSLNF